MSNVFQDVLSNASGAKEKYMGPDYPYYKYIKSHLILICLTRAL